MKSVKAEEELSLRFPACPLLSMLEAIRRPKNCNARCVPTGYIQPEGDLTSNSPSLSLTLQDGHWVAEDEEAEVNRGASKPSTWFR